MIQDIIDTVQPPERKEGEFTSAELAEQAGIDKDIMRKRLASAVERGELVREKRLVDGLMKYVYFKK